jgi:exopolysaccharide biosynthesis protein
MQNFKSCKPLAAFLLLIMILAISAVAWAKPNVATPIPYLDKVRYHADQDSFRIVLELTAIPAYTVSVTETPYQVEIELPDTVNRSAVGQLSFVDPFIDKLRFVDLGGGRVKAVISLKLPVLPKVSLLSSPNRLVIDLLKNYQSRSEYVIAPGLIYREFLAGRSAGPVKAHLLEVDFRAGYELRPVLSNDSVAGIEALSEMAARSQAVAMINGPYYMRSGEILGLLKIDRTLVSTPDTPRTSFGVLPDGKIIFDSPVYSGHVELPDKTKIPIDGVNRGRGESELILYNTYFAYWTLTSGGGREFLVRDGRIVDIRNDNSVIPEGTVVLSASGRQAWLMADLKIGDPLKIVQTLGPVWDKVTQAVGAGPCLVKNGEIYMTTLGEEFGSDVAGGRAPRTALGITKDGRALLVVVDGRSRASVGYTLLELARFMLEQGAVEAMNLDGGGSSQMIVGDQIVNAPSDGRERRLGAGIAVMKTRQQ